MNRKITRFALAGNCGGFGASGLIFGPDKGAAIAGEDSKPSLAIKPARPREANPLPIRPNIWRRVIRRSCGFILWSTNDIINLLWYSGVSRGTGEHAGPS